MADLVYFPWSVSEGCYKWLKVPLFKGILAARRLASQHEGARAAGLDLKELPRLPGGEPKDCLVLDGTPQTRKVYEPLKEQTGLFQHFADIDTRDKNNILEFANTFGLLGTGVSEQVVMPPDIIGVGEPYNAWIQEIRVMRDVLNAWKDLPHQRKDHPHDQSFIKRHIVWTDDFSGVQFTTHPDGSPSELLPEVDWFFEWTIASENMRSELLRRFTQGDVVEPAQHFIQQIVNERLTGRVAACLLWNKSWVTMGLHVVPTGLIGALWLQFARAVEGNKDYRRCAKCQTWYEVSPQAARKNRIFCSNACRVQSYRDRKARAIKFHHEGKEVSAIAAELNTEPETVQGWIDSASSR